MQGSITSSQRALAVFMVAFCTLPATGCMGLAASLLYFARGGDRVPAEYKGLDHGKVAVVCVSNNGATGPDNSTTLLARGVEENLRKNARKVTFVPQAKVSQWIDANHWDQIDFREIGRGLDVDKVLAINIGSLSLHDGGKAFYKGRADLTLAVYDMKDGGREVWHKSPPQAQFPQNGVHQSTELSEHEFRQLFLADLGEQVARRFYSYEVQDDFARDASLLRR